MNLEHLKNRIRAHEGYSKEPYLDTVGVLTIGYGHNIDWIRDKATHEVWLDEDIGHAIKMAHTFAGEVWDALTDTRREVLAEMAFQLGSRLLKFERMRAAVRSHQTHDVIKEMRDSRWYSQTPNRAENLIKLYEMG